MANPTSLTNLEKAIGINFRDKDLLAQSLTHRSSTGKRKAGAHNERLEFLGDAVLELVVTEELYHMSDRPEGELTNWRSALVQGDHLAEVAMSLKLGAYIYLSHGEEASGGREKSSTLANALEALIGAIYIDQGFEAARTFILTHILVKLNELLSQGRHRDEKSVFQELAQEKTGKTPTYRTLKEDGPDHDKTFTCAVLIGEEQIAVGTGNSKQRAEQAAAKEGLRKMAWK